MLGIATLRVIIVRDARYENDETYCYRNTKKPKDGPWKLYEYGLMY
jgi:hypothetical protein